MATQYDPDSKIKTKTKNKNFKQKEVKLRGYFEASYNIWTANLESKVHAPLYVKVGKTFRGETTLHLVQS